jgi:predicted N-acetyltransferase YhbS
MPRRLHSILLNNSIDAFNSAITLPQNQNCFSIAVSLVDVKSYPTTTLIFKSAAVNLEMKITIEAETEEDYEQIARLHTIAFNGDGEAKLVKKLRSTPTYIRELSLVAKYRNAIIGHVLFYPIKIKACRKECDSLALAPISVIPRYQNRKVGSRLIKEGLEKAKRLGFKSAIVVGHPEYYPRFGFEKASKYGISTSLEVPDNALFAIELEKDGLKDCSGTIEYPNEYNEI